MPRFHMLCGWLLGASLAFMAGCSSSAPSPKSEIDDAKLQKEAKKHQEMYNRERQNK